MVNGRFGLSALPDPPRSNKRSSSARRRGGPRRNSAIRTKNALGGDAKLLKTLTGFHARFQFLLSPVFRVEARALT